MARIRHVRVGDMLTDKLWNDVADKLEPWSKFDIVQGSFLELTTGPSGKQLNLRVPKEIPARLVGSSSPYSWVALADAAGGTYTDRVAGMTGGTSNAYEVNSVPNLGGRTVLLTWTSAGDWRFQHVGYGCVWTFVIKGCNNTAVLECVVSVKQGGVEIATCTGSSCTLSVPPGTYDVTVTPPAGSGYDTYTETLTHACSQTTNVVLSESSDWLCVDGICGPCQNMPRSIAITFNNNPLPCFQWPNLTLAIDPTFIIQPTWASTTTFLDGSGNESRLFMQCNPGANRYQLGATHAGSDNTPVGYAAYSGDGTGPTCNPFAISNGHIGFVAPFCGTWTAIGL